MMANLWFFCALGTAIMWGFGYALSEKVMKDSYHPLFIMVVTGFLYFVLSIVAAYFTNNLKGGLQTIQDNPASIVNVMLVSLSVVIGSFLILYAISLKNATLVNLIEITYPIFTLIFAYIIMKEVQISPATAFGGLLIFTGIGVIYLKA
jgi:drug/metabolite transporter (DMT)-like permease